MKNFQKHRKQYIGLIAISVITLVIGIKSVYAYYYQNNGTAVNVVDTKIADIYEVVGNKINSDDVDIKVKIYKPISAGVYTGSYEVPVGGSINNVTCTENVTCTKDAPVGDSKCFYVYDAQAGKITLENSGKAICSFYFN